MTEVRAGNKGLNEIYSANSNSTFSTCSTGMEYYSASLWHLEKTTELSLLADDLRHADILRPETWCVMGNLMSLNKDHESAIKFIERAIQVCILCAVCVCVCEPA